jgi:hypothetical protein
MNKYYVGTLLRLEPINNKVHLRYAKTWSKNNREPLIVTSFKLTQKELE